MRPMLLLLLATLAFAPAPARAAPGAQPWPLWERHDDANRAVIDQARWAGFLRSYARPGADGITRVAYAAVTPADRQGLEADIGRLTGLPISSYSRAEQRAYWTNLYNALTVLVVLRHMPVTSITRINLTPGLFSASGPWDAKLVQVEGTPLSLNDIEHRILRPIWRDPRTHYTVNCASLGCPNLALQPYAADTMEAMLERAARDYVNAPRGVAVMGGRVTASRIFDWYAADFGGSEAGVLAHVRRHAGPGLLRALEGVTGIAGYQYDWSLNAP